MDPYVRAHTHTHTHTHITNLRGQVCNVCVCADENCFSVQACHNSAALWEHWGTQKMSIEFIQRLYGVFMATVHRHGPIDPVGKKHKTSVHKNSQPCFILLVLISQSSTLNQREKHSMQFSLTRSLLRGFGWWIISSYWCHHLSEWISSSMLQI